MLNQEISLYSDEQGLSLKLCEAPVARQVAAPDADLDGVPASTARLVAEVLGNVLIGSALLAGLLAAPAVLGLLLGLV